jgi:hypothetical protein
MPKITDPALLAQPGLRRIGPANPMVQADLTNKGLDAENKRVENLLKRQELGKPQILGDSGFMFDPASKRAVPIPGYKPKAQQVDPARLESLRALEAQIKRVANLYQQGPGATSGIAGLMDYLPSPANKQFDTASSGIGDVAFNAFRTPGAGAQSDAELKARLAATQPTASDYDSSIEEKLGYLQNRLASSYKTFGVPYRPVALRKPKAKSSANDGGSIEEVK